MRRTTGHRSTVGGELRDYPKVNKASAAISTEVIILR
jgi:hypothetical protein